MAELTDAEVVKAFTRIEQNLSPQEVVSEAFPDPREQVNFCQGLSALAAEGALIHLGGRRLREQLGCRAIDVAEDVVWDAYNALSDHQMLRLKSLVRILRNYPTERMVKPDLDFFYWKVPSQQVLRTFKQEGFKVSQSLASGNVAAINVKGTSGVATFVDGFHSWQTGEGWPMYGAMAKYENAPEPNFRVDIGYGRLYLYPLEIPSLAKDPLEPQRFAAIARALLWACTATPPGGGYLAVPFEHSQSLFAQTVSHFAGLIRSCQQNPTLEDQYRSGIRDMALALRIIILTDWDQMAKENQISTAHASFFGRIGTAWWPGNSDDRKLEIWEE